MEQGVRVVLSAAQVAAILTGESLDEPATFTNRLWGGLRVVGGTLELIGAGALCLAPEPTMTSKAGCVVFGLHGADTIAAGTRQVWTGRDTADLIQHGATKLARTLGADPASAEQIGLAVDIGVPLAVSGFLGAARLAAVRGGLIRLVEHEGPAGARIGGHTIARHIGKTEADLRARLTAEPQLRVVASFTSLRVAEGAISDVLRAHSASVKAWAQAAIPASTLRLNLDVGYNVGSGVLRTGDRFSKTTKLRVVLRHQTFNGKPYYILTAFPVP